MYSVDYERIGKKRIYGDCKVEFATIYAQTAKHYLSTDRVEPMFGQLISRLRFLGFGFF